MAALIPAGVPLIAPVVLLRLKPDGSAGVTMNEVGVPSEFAGAASEQAMLNVQVSVSGE